MDAMILSGVIIGQGAVVAAKSVVTKSVPPYAIVAGNPAAVIRYRFPDNVISQLLTIDYSQIDEAVIRTHSSLFVDPLTEDTAAQLDRLPKRPPPVT
jgi:carbonic anhydrase/acetyltransferase-like protein (isoleucine patch superfamily)